MSSLSEVCHSMRSFSNVPPRMHRYNVTPFKLNGQIHRQIYQEQQCECHIV